ncbi:CRISPR-associated helicase Cas3' [Nordella sp. HKS 07]|uniref:CRISPR-associated helicase Cas3' n=1 Tax=Nordella sp. HKS 07 TaxID=2712222 RepID=UPI0013E123FA|nr:CRISPR-associated helicase Cas3' [Nordella sp. HKS 07]QIG50138.1 CRISPR-associated helicase Cas3' [Nordella sp. HKS 07]
MEESLHFWSKTRPDGEVRSHPLVYHSLDVAAMFELLLSDRFGYWRVFERSFGAPIAAIAPALTALVALHDLGKVAVGFQAKVEQAWPAALLGAWPGRQNRYDHAEGSARLLVEDGHATFLDGIKGASNRRAVHSLLLAIAYHHGKPMDRIANGTPMSVPKFVRAGDAALVATSILAAFDPSPPLPSIDGRSARTLSWLLSGLVSLADWIGSGRDFAFRLPELSPREYWLNVARPTALAAIARLRLEPAQPSIEPGSTGLLEDGWQATPAQHMAVGLPLPDGPLLVMIEDTTGSGKTEAALVLARRMMQQAKGAGIFIALPTTATADAMYSRMAEQYRRLFATGALPSLALAHGRRRLNPLFCDSILPDGDVAEIHDEESVGVICAAFFADDRRKVFLAEVGVGTVDQALLAVLPSRYATLRLAGIASKILIIDEAHAYDAYMQKEVETLLAFHAAAGGSAIVLSATLPRGMKEKYARAFRNLGHDDTVSLDTLSYPLFTTVSANREPVSNPVAPHVGTSRSVKATRLENRDEALSRIAAATRAGACAVYIRNSVDDAIEAWQGLKDEGLEPLLFHARFVMADRLAVEREVLRVFGKHSTRDQRRGRILVATQVVEQSLDLDFDVMASDLAPIDLLIQRAGRLWRHSRGDRPVPGPELLVVSPEPLIDIHKTWAAAAFPRGAYVYRNHAVLWKSAKVLFEAGTIRSPDNLRDLIESVYGAFDVEIPAALTDNADFSEGRESAETSQAKQNVLPLEDGYAGSRNAAWNSDIAIPTRLGEPQTLFRLAHWQDGALIPYATAGASGNSMLAWALSEMSIARRRATGRGAVPTSVEQAALAIERLWREQGDAAVVLPIIDSRLSLLDDRNQTRGASYASQCGLAWEGPG